jgi:hypothetical protein
MPTTLKPQNCNQKKRMKWDTTDELHDDTLLVLDEKTRLVHGIGQWIERDWGIGWYVFIYLQL